MKNSKIKRCSIKHGTFVLSLYLCNLMFLFEKFKISTVYTVRWIRKLGVEASNHYLFICFQDSTTSVGKIALAFYSGLFRNKFCTFKTVFKHRGTIVLSSLAWIKL